MVGGVEGGSEEEAGAVGEVDEDGGGGAGVAGGEVHAEGGEEGVFVFDLGRTLGLGGVVLGGERGYGGVHTITFVLTSAVTIESRHIRSRAFRCGSRYANTSP